MGSNDETREMGLPEDPLGGEESIVEPGDLPPFWKPTVDGETETGILMSVRTTGFKDSEALRVKTRERGLISIPVTEALKDVPWFKLIGRTLTFTYVGTVETKSGRDVKQFRVTAKKLEDIPF